MLRLIQRVALLALLAGVFWLLGVTSASASRGIRPSSGTTLFVTARGPMTINTAGVNIICTVDAFVGINSTMAKSVGAALGGWFGAGFASTISNCNGGYSGTFDTDANITFVSWGGTLPSSITSLIGLFSPAFTLTGGTVFGVNRCQFTGRLTLSLSGPGTSISGMSARGSVTTLPFPCPSSGRVTNSALSLYGTLTSVAIVLI